MLTACGSSKTVQTQDPIPASTTAKAPNTAPAATVQRAEQFVSSLNINFEARGNSIDLSGKVSVKKDQLVRLNLTYMGFIEIGLVEFSPKDILIVNRFNKECARVPYDTEFLIQNNITFDNVQEMAYNEVYSTSGRTIEGGNSLQELFNKAMGSAMRGAKVNASVKIGKPDTGKKVTPTEISKNNYRILTGEELSRSLTRMMQSM